MKRVFPEMTDRIGNGYVFTVFAYWLFAFVMFPFALPIVVYGLYSDITLLSWVEIIYHIINGAVMLFVLKGSLADFAFRVRMKLRSFLVTVGITFCLMMVVRELAILMLESTDISMMSVYDIYPISEFDVLLTAGYTVGSNPIFGTICMAVFASISITGLFYASSFAPICCKRPWLGYIMVTVILALVTGFDIFWRGFYDGVLITFLLRLPIHLLACWSYQKENTVWAPIVSLCLFNLTTALLNIQVCLCCIELCLGYLN